MANLNANPNHESGDRNLQRLIFEQIKASNRTTRAVRAFVLFFFIQLFAATLAGAALAGGVFLQDPSDCYLGVCEPNAGVQFIAGAIWLAGFAAASFVGWSELSQSRVEPVSWQLLETVAEGPAKDSSAAPADDSPAQRFCQNCGEPISPTAVACVACDTWQTR